MITFAIFYLMPRLAGASPETLATRYVGRTATATPSSSPPSGSASTTPSRCSTATGPRASSSAPTIDIGVTQVEHARRPCLGYSFRNQDPVCPEILKRLPVTFSLAIGAAVLWLVMGLSVGVISALRRGSLFDRAAMTLALAGVSMPIFWTGLMALSFFSYKLGWTPPGATYTPFTENPLQWAYGLLLPWITLALLFSAQYARLTRAGMLETMNEDYIRTARAKGLRGAHRGRQARPARRADPDRDDLRPRLRPADRQRGAHRDGLRPARSRQVRHRRAPSATTCRRCWA